MTAPYLDLEAEIARRSSRAWFEMHGAILDKDRKLQRGLLANKLQRDFDRIQSICERDNLPCRIVTLKGRQQGSSTYSVAAIYHMLRKAAKKACIIGDEYEKSVANLEVMFATYAKHDRMRWGSTFYEPGQSFSHGSVLVTETANDPRAGASGTMQAVLATEVAWWKETKKISARATMAALLNCVPQTPGTLIVVESTPNGASGVYYETFQAAVGIEDYEAGRIPANWNGFFRIEYWWHEHPEYDVPDISAEDEHEIMTSLTEREDEMVRLHGIPASRLAWRRKILKSAAFSGDEDKFDQEYPTDADSCFLLSGRRVYPAAQLRKMRRRFEANPHHKVGLFEEKPNGQTIFREEREDDSIVRIYEDRLPGRKYLCVVDPATGESQTTGADPDSHAPIIRREGYFDEYGEWIRPKIVARLCDVWAERRVKRAEQAVCRWDVDVLATNVRLLSRYYGNCTIVVEMNKDSGLARQLQGMGCSMYLRRQWNRVTQGTTELLGWMTSPNASASGVSRKSIIELTKRAIRLDGQPGEGLDLSEVRILRQFETMIVDLAGKEEAGTGEHDDLVLAIAIAEACKECSTTYVPQPGIDGRRRRGQGWGDDEDGPRGPGLYS